MDNKMSKLLIKKMKKEVSKWMSMRQNIILDLKNPKVIKLFNIQEKLKNQ